MIAIVFLARGVARLIALIVLPLVALTALAFAVAALIGQNSAMSLARSTHLTSAWRQVGHFLVRVAPEGHPAAVLAAIAAILLGVTLLFGTLAPARERELRLDDDPDLGVRRRALQDALQNVPTRMPGVTSTTVRLQGRRRTAYVATTLTPRARQEEIATGLTRQLEPLSRPFDVKVRVRGSMGRRRRARLS